MCATNQTKIIARPSISNAGFTLIEIMVVVSIVTIAFVSIIGLVQKAIILYYNNKNVMIANNLAQEGLELVRFVRDDNWMTPETYSVPYNYFARDISVDNNGTNNTDPAQQKGGNLYMFTIDTRVLTDDPATRTSIADYYEKFTDRAGVSGNIQVGMLGCDGVIKTCLQLTQAQLYRDQSNADNIIYRHLSAAPNTDQYATGFHRLIVTEYRDPYNTPNELRDDYLHVESWVRWRDRGKDKFFHLDTDLYDYAWRK